MHEKRYGLLRLPGETSQRFDPRNESLLTTYKSVAGRLN